MSTFWCETAVIGAEGALEVANGVRLETQEGRISSITPGPSPNQGTRNLQELSSPQPRTPTHTLSTGFCAAEPTTGAEISGCGGNRCIGARPS